MESEAKKVQVSRLLKARMYDERNMTRKGKDHDLVDRPRKRGPQDFMEVCGLFLYQYSKNKNIKENLHTRINRVNYIKVNALIQLS